MIKRAIKRRKRKEKNLKLHKERKNRKYYHVFAGFYIFKCLDFNYFNHLHLKIHI